MSKTVEELFGSDPEDDDSPDAASTTFALSLTTASPEQLGFERADALESPGTSSGDSGDSSSTGRADGSFASSPSGSSIGKPADSFALSLDDTSMGAGDDDEVDAASLAGRRAPSSFALSLDDVDSLDSDEERPVENNGVAQLGVSSQDLFGDADDISTDDSGDEERQAASSRENATTSGRRKHAINEDCDDDMSRAYMMDSDEDQPAEEPSTTTIEAELPVFPSMMQDQIFFVKLPNFLSVEPRAFDPDNYEEEVDEDELLDEEGRTRLKLKLENTMRWRYAKDPRTGEERRESNARIVKWSDGSSSLLLGSEVFDIHQTQLVGGDHSHLFVQQGTGLQGQAVFGTKLTFRPHSTDSHTHRKITMSIADRFSKTQKIRVLPVAFKDPDTHRSEMLRKEEERLRSVVRLENRQRRQRERSQARGKLTVPFLEDRDDDDETSISAIKRSFGVGNRGKSAVKKKPASKWMSSSSDDSGDEKEDEDEENDDNEDEEEDNEEEEGEDEEEEEEEEDDEDDEEEEEDEDEEEEGDDDGFIDDTGVGKVSKTARLPPAETHKRPHQESDVSHSKKKKARSKMVISSSDDESD